MDTQSLLELTKEYYNYHWTKNNYIYEVEDDLFKFNNDEHIKYLIKNKLINDINNNCIKNMQILSINMVLKLNYMSQIILL
jgi:hypothetical protein